MEQRLLINVLLHVGKVGGVCWESGWSLWGKWWESIGKLVGVCWESGWSLLGKWLESVGKVVYVDWRLGLADMRASVEEVEVKQLVLHFP